MSTLVTLPMTQNYDRECEKVVTKALLMQMSFKMQKSH